jgi:uncharacterized membrane protein YkvA (DUF1232 family)
MRNFDELLRQEIDVYEGRHDDLIYLAPDFYRLLVRLLDDPKLPLRLRPLISSAIAYFILPADIISEELHGPYGYVDDIWLCAYVSDIVRQQLGDDDILIENWEGEAPIIPLILEVLRKERELIGDERDRILWYTGCSQFIGIKQVTENSPSDHC